MEWRGEQRLFEPAHARGANKRVRGQGRRHRTRCKQTGHGRVQTTVRAGKGQRHLEPVKAWSGGGAAFVRTCAWTRTNTCATCARARARGWGDLEPVQARVLVVPADERAGPDPPATRTEEMMRALSHRPACCLFGSRLLLSFPAATDADARGGQRR